MRKDMFLTISLCPERSFLRQGLTALLGRRICAHPFPGYQPMTCLADLSARRSPLGGSESLSMGPGTCTWLEWKWVRSKKVMQLELAREVMACRRRCYEKAKAWRRKPMKWEVLCIYTPHIFRRAHRMNKDNLTCVCPTNNDAPIVIENGYAAWNRTW